MMPIMFVASGISSTSVERGSTTTVTAVVNIHLKFNIKAYMN